MTAYQVVDWVKQQHVYGCGIAALAMINRRSYNQVRDWFLERGRDIEANRGGTMFDWDLYLVKHGFTVAREFRYIFGKLQEPWPPAPFGTIHLCEVRPNQTQAHLVVMLDTGEVLDPAKRGVFTLGDYPMVESVAACERCWMITDL